MQLARTKTSIQHDSPVHVVADAEKQMYVGGTTTLCGDTMSDWSIDISDGDVSDVTCPSCLKIHHGN